MIRTDFSSDDIIRKYGVYPLLHTHVGKPQFLQFVGDVDGKHILDLGCGNGHFAHEFSQRGADVVAVDSSPTFIAQGKERYPHLDLRVLNAAALEGIPAAAFDTIVMVMVLVNISERKQFEDIFRECKRVLKTGGELIISTVHPLAMRPFKDALREVSFADGAHYFSPESKVMVRFLLSNLDFIDFTDTHWTLEDISRELERNQFVITQMREPRPTEGTENWQYIKDALVTPHYLFIKAQSTARSPRRI